MHGIATIKKLNDDKNFNKQALEALRQPKSVFGDKGQPKLVPSVGK